MPAVLESLCDLPARGPTLACAGSLEVTLAERPSEVDQALRLRYRVFGEEMGARLDDAAGVDRDVFDPFCRHLIVRDVSRDEVVGTYRVMLPEQARRIGRFYTEQEFWLSRLAPIRDEMVELGRACVHPKYRTGATILLLWSGLGEFLARHECRFLIGCVSVPMADDGSFAATLYRQLARDHLADESMRVWPRDRLPVERFASLGHVPVPPLMKGYLRAGAKILGEPHRDASFGCADFPMLLSLERLERRYQRRFMQ